MIAEQSPSYTCIAIFLHWSIAILVMLNIGGGLLMVSYPKHALQHDAILFWHASLGMLVLLLAVLRVCWRLGHRPPPLPSRIAKWQRGAAQMMHGLLYVLMLALPFSGYLHRLAGGHDVAFFGWFDFPRIIAQNEPYRVFTHNLHVTLAWVLCILLVGHLGAALQHALVAHDGVLQRMLPMRPARVTGRRNSR